ncbi:MAG: C45 family autoproteolytic acyltransferase/hydrolase [Chloroflexota bacterium]
MDNITFLHLKGSPRQRGQIHGEELRAQIASVLDLWRVDIEKETRLPFETYLRRFLSETGFRPAIERWSPGLLEEVRGLAEGAGQDFPTMFAFQCMDEDWWFRSSLSPRAHCSSIGVYGEGGAPILAQNMDIHVMTDGAQVLLHLQQGELETLVFSFAGFLGLTGLNSRPLGVCVNTLPQLSVSAGGLPVAFMVRALLEQSTLEEAEKFLCQVQHASGQNYMLGNGQEIRDFECSANAVVQVTADGRRLRHTNHPLVSADFHPGFKPPEGKIFSTNSTRRLEMLAARLDAGEVGPGAVKDILRTPPVCVQKEAGDDFYTSGSLVMTLASSPLLELTAGPPSQSEYRTFTFLATPKGK